MKEPNEQISPDTVQEWMSAHIDGMLNADDTAALQAYIDNTPGAADALAELKALVGALSDLPEVTPPPDLYARVKADIDADAQDAAARPAFSITPWLRRAAGIAAVLLIFRVGYHELWDQKAPREASEALVFEDSAGADNEVYPMDSRSQKLESVRETAPVAEPLAARAPMPEPESRPGTPARPEPLKRAEFKDLANTLAPTVDKNVSDSLQETPLDVLSGAATGSASTLEDMDQEEREASLDDSAPLLEASAVLETSAPPETNDKKDAFKGSLSKAATAPRQRAAGGRAAGERDGAIWQHALPSAVEDEEAGPAPADAPQPVTRAARKIASPAEPAPSATVAFTTLLPDRKKTDRGTLASGKITEGQAPGLSNTPGGLLSASQASSDVSAHRVSETAEAGAESDTTLALLGSDENSLPMRVQASIADVDALIARFHVPEGAEAPAAKSSRRDEVAAYETPTVAPRRTKASKERHAPGKTLRVFELRRSQYDAFVTELQKIGKMESTLAPAKAKSGWLFSSNKATDTITVYLRVDPPVARAEAHEADTD